MSFWRRFWRGGILKDVQNDIDMLKRTIEATEPIIAEAIKRTDQSFVAVEKKTATMRESITAEGGFDPDEYTPSPAMMSVKRLEPPP